MVTFVMGVSCFRELSHVFWDESEFYNTPREDLDTNTNYITVSVNSQDDAELYVTLYEKWLLLYDSPIPEALHPEEYYDDLSELQRQMNNLSLD